MKIALYLRVSTTRDQTTDSQRLELIEHCRRRGWDDITEYEDVISGAKTARPGLDALMAAVRRGRVDAVVCVKMDRLGRSLAHLAQILGQLTDNNVALIAPGQGIDTSTSNPAAKLQIHVLMAVAEFEREIIRERTFAGLRAARARGSVFGRRQIKWTPAQVETIETWEGTVKGLSTALGCSVGKAHAVLRQCEAT